MFTQRLQGMGDAALMAMKQLSQIVHRQAVVMGYGDAFFMLTAVLFRPQPAGHAFEKACRALAAAATRTSTCSMIRITRACHVANHPRCIYKQRIVARTGEDLHDFDVFADRALASDARAGCCRSLTERDLAGSDRA